MTDLRVASLLIVSILSLPGAAPAQAQGTRSAIKGSVTLEAVAAPVIVDPKLVGGDVPIRYLLQPRGTAAHVQVRVLRDDHAVATVFSGVEQGADQPREHTWNGRDTAGRFVDPGAYQVEVVAGTRDFARLTYDLHVVRLGITEIEAQPTKGNDEWQMVYFRKGTKYEFFATPSIHEYLNVADLGEVSDLDLNDGEPRTAAPLHTATDQPPMEGDVFEDDRYNFPVCYLGGSQPTFEAVFGATCTSQQGTAIGCGYPLPSFAIRAQLRDDRGVWHTQANNIAPGGKARFRGPDLPLGLTREDRTLHWSWQYAPTGTNDWVDVPGALATEHRFYLTVGVPLFNAGGSGTQYSGPWVEAAEYASAWRRSLTTSRTGEAGLVDVFMKGFFGQNQFLPTAIEGVVYDCPSMGGDGGASHYYLFSSETVRLSHLLHAHGDGIYVNCSDVASCTSSMLGMLGVQGVQMLRLGSMTLRAIWGIGTPDYTVDLWGNGSHGFSYHHIITRDGGTNVSDSCMWLDEDGDPNHLPGTPGFNCDRPWNGTHGEGYEELSAKNNVTKSLDPLPKIK